MLLKAWPLLPVSHWLLSTGRNRGHHPTESPREVYNDIQLVHWVFEPRSVCLQRLTLWCIAQGALLYNTYDRHMSPLWNVTIPSSPRFSLPLIHPCTVITTLSIYWPSVCVSYLTVFLPWVIPGEITVCWMDIRFNTSFNNQNNVMRFKSLFSHRWKTELYWDHIMKKLAS